MPTAKSTTTPKKPTKATTAPKAAKTPVKATMAPKVAKAPAKAATAAKAAPKLYTYKGQQFDSEHAMVLHLLDDYRCVEGFAARYLRAWKAVAQTACIKGGLRTFCGREQLHADMLEARLLELGGIPQCEVAPERLADLAYYGSMEQSDMDKLGKIAMCLSDPDKTMQFLTHAIAQIQEDQDTRELLSTIHDDERSSIRWVVDSWKMLQSSGA